MRFAAIFLLSALCASAQDSKKDVLSVVNRLFEGMSAHDAQQIASTMTPDAKLVSTTPDKVSPPIAGADFASRIAANKSRLLERIWNPTVLIRGRIAVVWAEYDFHADGKFGHCGVDSFDLLKTEDGWKISAIQYTSETEHCKPSPLGPPK